MRGTPDLSWLSSADVARFPLRLIFQGQYMLHSAPAGFRADAAMVCGFLGCDRQPFNPLIAARAVKRCLRA